MSKFKSLMLNRKGFSLIEVLVTIAVLTVLGFVVTDILSRTIRGGNKTELISLIRQNGQSALDSLDSSIRASDDVVCTGNWEGGSGFDTLVTTQNGKYTRFHFYLQNGSSNGYIAVDYPTSDPTTPNGLLDPNNPSRLCDAPGNGNFPAPSPNPPFITTGPTKAQSGTQLTFTYNGSYSQIGYYARVVNPDGSFAPNSPNDYFYYRTCSTTYGYPPAPSGTCSVVPNEPPGTYKYISSNNVSSNNFTITNIPPVPGIPQDSSSGTVILTDTNTTTGVSIVNGSFSVTTQSGFKPTVAINFNMGPGVNAGGGAAGQIGSNNSVNFQTSVELR